MGPIATRPIRLLVFSASLRRGSLNTRLAELAAMTLEGRGVKVDRASMREFDCPSYDLDVEDRYGLPPGAQGFRARLEACDGFIVSSPEYNGSLPGLLKNTIDWVSRYRPPPFDGHHGLLLSASPSMVGGNRGLWALRVPFERLGAHVYPDMFSLARAHTAFTPTAGSPTPSFSSAWSRISLASSIRSKQRSAIHASSRRWSSTGVCHSRQSTALNDSREDHTIVMLLGRSHGSVSADAQKNQRVDRRSAFVGHGRRRRGLSSGGVWRGVSSDQELQSLRGASVMRPSTASSGSYRARSARKASQADSRSSRIGTPMF